MACNEIHITHCVRKGDSGPVLLFYVDTIPTDLLTCQWAVYRKEEYGVAGTVPVIGPIVPDVVDDGGTDKFQVALTPAQTATLTVGTYVWAFELTSDDSVPPYNREFYDNLRISAESL